MYPLCAFRVWDQSVVARAPGYTFLQVSKAQALLSLTLSCKKYINMHLMSQAV